MQQELEVGSSPGAARPVIVLSAVRAPVSFVRDLVDVVELHVTPAGGEVLVGVDDTGRLALFVAGIALAPLTVVPPVPLVPPAANSRAANSDARAPRPRQSRRPQSPVGAGVVPDDWLAVLRALHGNGDTIGDVKGRATRELGKVMGLELDGRTLGQLLHRLKGMEKHHYISRVSKTTATYEIRLEPAGLAIVDQEAAEAPTVDLTEDHRGGASATVVPMTTPGPGRDGAMQDRLRHAAASAMYAND